MFVVGCLVVGCCWFLVLGRWVAVVRFDSVWLLAVVVGHWLLVVVGRWLLVVGSWLAVVRFDSVGHWLLVICCCWWWWLLVVGCWLMVIGC